MRTRRRSTRIRHGGGFTMMEMIIAMGVFALLMAGIFAIAKSSMELSSDLASNQERSMMRQNLIDYLRRSFRSLPGNAEIRLQNRSVGGTYIPSLTIVNGGSSFSPGEAVAPDTGLELTAEQRPGGYLRVQLRVLDDQQTLALRSGQNVRPSKNEAVLTLMDRVSQFEWKLYDVQTQRWENVWKEARRPLMAEMVVQLDDGLPMRAVFWIPPVIPAQNPAVLAPIPGAPGSTPPDPNAPAPPPAPAGS
jgi:prepilin-type N-terminal cleavage/methylation domain-containing protein